MTADESKLFRSKLSCSKRKKAAGSKTEEMRI